MPVNIGHIWYRCLIWWAFLFLFFVTYLATISKVDMTVGSVGICMHKCRAYMVMLHVGCVSYICNLQPYVFSDVCQICSLSLGTWWMPVIPYVA